MDTIDAGQATAAIVSLSHGYGEDPTPAQIVTLGTEMVVYAQRDAAFRSIVNASALSLCDTAGLLAVARARGAVLRERVTGVDLIGRLARAFAQNETRLYLFGGAPGVAERAAAVLQSRNAGLRIAGARNGYFAPGEEAAICETIAASGAQVLLAGLGSPRQEFWLAEHLASTGCRVGIGVGGSFDVISGNVARAPRLMRDMHLEWLYRLMREPQRWRRQLALPKFVFLIATERIFKRG